VMSDEVTQISLGKFTVGIAGLKEAIEEVRALGERPDEKIAQALLVRLKPRNYIPASAEDEYRQAFLREFKKALGEQVEEERRGLHIKILGPGCPVCDRLEQTTMTVLAEMGLPAEVEHVREVREIAALGIMSTPALLINGEVKAMGTEPTRAMLKKWLEEISCQK
jgi:small redox-active disulfide protein 2